MARVVHFEIQVDDVERAKQFYASAFEWSFVDYGHVAGSPYWGVQASGARHGAAPATAVSLLGL